MVAGRLPQSASPLLGFCSSVHRSCSPHRRSSSSDHGRRTPTVMKPGSAARETGRTVPKTTTITTTPSSSAASDCEDTSSPHGPLCHLHHRFWWVLLSLGAILLGGNDHKIKGSKEKFSGVVSAFLS
ncbi:uncharacterized protein HKW66_Vig0089930 [Vigna angularis]|uniref:Uncharacterized protein n=1 Tax=Phaseolus angularis TaxID=3914 RepID=A0A8T0KFW6_PHAAN|nr:uncharacterized protein HKW66_Vig0089930 [Vigna angularis]